MLFTLVENFKYLLKELELFVDPAFTYSSVKHPELKGGKRRIERSKRHTDYYNYAYGAIIKLGGVENVGLVGGKGDNTIECEKWMVSHPEFKDEELGEKYPEPEQPYTCLITSRQSLKNGAAKRYYVSCNCPDFRIVFKQELIDRGYTGSDGSLSQQAGVRKQAPAICKHLYTIIVKEYQEAIQSEAGPAESALVMTNVQVAAPTTPTVQTPEETIKTIDKTKALQIIMHSLKHYNNLISDSDIESYRIRQSGKFSQYKFGIRFLGLARLLGTPYYAISFISNNQARLPLIGPDNTVYHKDVIPYIYSLFSKQELIDLITKNTTPRSPQLSENIKKLNSSFLLCEGVEFEDLTVSNTITALLESY